MATKLAPKPDPVKALLLAARGLSPRLVGAAKVARQLERNRPRAKLRQAGEPKFGINKALGPQSAAQILGGDPRQNNPGPNAVERRDEE